MTRRITNHPGNSLCGTITVDTGFTLGRRRRVQAHAGVVVIKDEDAVVVWIDCAADAGVAGTEITVGDIGWPGVAVMRDCLTAPGTILPMGRDDHPFFTQRMPTLFPRHVVGPDPARADSRSEAICRRSRRSLRI